MHILWKGKLRTGLLWKNPEHHVMKCNFSSFSEHKNLRKFILMKRFVYTSVFGCTFLAVLYAKKHNRIKSIQNAKLVPVNSNYQKNFKLYEYRGYILPSFVMKTMDEIASFACRASDVYVVSFPKTGTTWVQEITYCVMNGVTESPKSIEDRFPYLEFVYPGLSSIKNAVGQRFIKTHLPFSLLPEDIHKKKPKIICIFRHPKDVLVSYYHFVRMNTLSDYKGSLENFFKEFLSGSVPYGPVWKHYNETWLHRNDPNILILSYEDLHKDISRNIRKIANFLGKDLTEQDINGIAKHCSFRNMSNNPSVNYQHWDDLGIRNKNEAKFFRKGEVGDWKNYFTPDMNEAMNSWIDEHLKDIQIFF